MTFSETGVFPAKNGKNWRNLPDDRLGRPGAKKGRTWSMMRRVMPSNTHESEQRESHETLLLDAAGAGLPVGNCLGRRDGRGGERGA
jgi:hypothetical protein